MTHARGAMRRNSHAIENVHGRQTSTQLSVPCTREFAVKTEDTAAKLAAQSPVGQRGRRGAESRWKCRRNWLKKQRVREEDGALIAHQAESDDAAGNGKAADKAANTQGCHKQRYKLLGLRILALSLVMKITW